MTSFIDQSVHDIRRRGFRVIVVGGGIDDDGNGAPCTYSIGLRALDHPDILVTGLPPVRASLFIASIYQSLQNGTRRTPGVLYDDLAQGFLTQFKPVTPFWRDRAMLLNDNCYRAINGDPTFDALQLCFPDRHHQWAWEAGFDPDARRFQPRLDLAPLPPRYAGDTTIRAVLGAGFVA